MKKSLTKFTAKVLMCSLWCQLIYPNYVYALTSGPTTPEVQSFEPVGMTEMVDMFTGDFTYNIPLMDVEGFPINMSYHAGAGIEQEASWVGLGWNINPGEINRSVRGLPDDFNGETIEKKINIENEVDWRVALGANISAELFGFNPNQYGFNLSLGVGTYVGFNNYKGVSVGANLGVTVSTPVASGGIDVGLGSQSGADIDVNAGLNIPMKITDDVGAGIGVSGGTGFNSRTGLKDLSFGMNAGAQQSYTRERKVHGETKKVGYSQNIAGGSFGSSIPIGLQNYVPVITNESVQNTLQFQARLGGEIFYGFPNVHLSVMRSELSYGKDGSRSGYGYFYAENAPKEGIMDFSREKDGYYNNTLKNLPLASMTYDIYSISGQGTGGMFRPFRNDIGTVFDPFVNPPKSSSFDVKLEAGIGNLFEIGTDVTFYDNENKSGPWKQLPFRGGDTGSFYEKVYFKQAGELTYNNQQLTTGIFNDKAQYLAENGTTLLGKGRATSGSMPSKFGNSYVYTGSTADRTTRANLLSFITAGEADVQDVVQSKKILSDTNNGTQPFNNPLVYEYDRYSTSPNQAKKHHITEFTQTLPDGRRYIYGIPAMNKVTREVTFGVSGSNANLNTGIVKIDKGSNPDNSQNNKKGKEHFYSHTGTPAYAYSYLLTSVLSKDYVDVLGDGPTDDDLGSFTKINYTRWNNDYRWRAPYSADSAQYNPGFWSDNDDDKGSYIMGSKQIWHIRSIETKNYVAEFYVSQRDDGKGLTDSILPSGSSVDAGGLYAGLSSEDQHSYKLDSIKLFNKHDRYLNDDNAVPVKTVIFRYSYRLCKGIPNSFNQNSSESNPLVGGKLTLERIYIKYGNSGKNLLSPYVFTYGINPQYNFASKDRWGNYQPSNSTLSSFEYPYVKQESTDADVNAGAWCLTDIKLPSGGKIHVAYESDDYSYVQDKRSMQMFHVEGVGSSSKFEEKSALYESVDRVNNYVYFKRRTDRENYALSMKDNYLEGTNTLYYSFNLDISARGKFEHIKGYADIEEVGKCPNDTSYGYIKLKKERPGNNSNHLLHPATIYGLNTGKYYLPHIMYPGYKGGSGPIEIIHGLKAAASELFSIAQNPIVRFVEKDKKGKNIKIAKSWIRLNVPGLTKKGGGLRVKELALNDAWNTLTGSDSTDYGKKYDYTVWDSKWNRNVSSGVASYEPMVGGDENPFKMPVPYTGSAGRLLPATKFFQEEPFGESFFPPPVVGYSKVTVKSIHEADARSAQSQEEQTFYTAKDFPIEVDYTEKDAPSPIKTKTLRKRFEEVKVMQGYVLKFNDMHGKPKGTAYYIINTDGTNIKRELVSGVTYNYRVDNTGKLDNQVNAVVRSRGTANTYSVEELKLGEEMDFTVDSRERDIRAYSRNVDINVNVVLFGFIPIPIPTAFFPDKEEKTIFHSLVSTKIIQKYGILKSIETYDHGAKIKTENLLYDSETGGVLLTKTNNEYSGGENSFKGTYDLKLPAYWAYEGMQPSYKNAGYEEKADSLVIEEHVDFSCYYGRLCISSRDKFVPGDELLLSYKVGATSYNVKAWVVEDERYYGQNELPPYIHYFYEPYPRIKDIDFSLEPYDTEPGRPYCEVVLRALKDGSGNLLWPGGLTEGSKVNNVYVKILRSGRRNNLDQNVQHSILTENPYSTDLAQLISTGSAYSSVLNVSAKKFSDIAAPYSSVYGDDTLIKEGEYDPNIYPNAADAANMRELNRYVTGHNGNFRPTVEYIFNTSRDYSDGNIKSDGTFSLAGNGLWSYQQNMNSRTILNSLNPGISSNWIKQSEITKYDVNGNAIEEIDPVGKYSAAQYGYNKSLPLAVASNARQKGFCYEGFEDYGILVPKYLRDLFQGSYYYFTPFSKNFNDVQSSMTRYKQEYVRLNLTASNGDVITNAASHTGSYSILCASASAFDIPIRNVTPEINAGYFTDPLYFSSRSWVNVKDFSMDIGRKYVVSLWLKPASGSAASIASNTLITITQGSSYSQSPFQVKTGNIDGWYKAECIMSTTLTLSNTASITLPSGAYFDDIRFTPIDVTLKSFVYDPVSFKPVAELDENNFATFYEYDQEGLLVRVKKETDRGIVTLKESRRANQKN